MFVQYFSYAERPLGEVIARFEAALDEFNGWAVESYRSGEALRTRIGPGDSGVAKEIRLEIGSPLSSRTATRVPITWEATGTPGLFPRMAAELVFSAVGEGMTQVKLQGTYEPPLGGVGRLIDRTMLHRVAENTVKDFVDRLTQSLNAEDQELKAAAEEREP